MHGDSLKRRKTVPFIRSKAWKELREKALERDGRKCVLCGSDQNLQVHHIWPRKFHKNLQEDLDNLVVLCSRHHWRQHKDAGYLELAVYLMQNRPEQWKYVLKNLKTPAANTGISI